MKRQGILTLLLMQLAMPSVMAQTSVTISGDSDWLFRYAKTEAEADAIVADGFFKPGYAAQLFSKVYVPSNWAVQGFEEPVYRGFSDKTKTNDSGDTASEGLYIKHFTLPSSFGGKRVLLNFGGVWNSAEVWLNGKPLGRHDSGYTSFSMNVTGVAVKGDNTLAVRVRQVYPGYKTDTYDDWTLGGIYRDVTLTAMPKSRWIDRVTAVTDFDAAYRDARVTLKMMIADTHKETLPGNYRSPGNPYSLHVTLTDADGKAVCDETVSCQSHTTTSREQQLTLMVRNARKWTAETPHLYSLNVDLIETDGRVVQSHSERIGLRKVETRDGVLRVNGQPVKLRGVNRHDEWPTVGRATTREHWLKDLELMKQANINYVRAAHYQHAKGFIEMCDSVGMYVGAEVSLGGAAGRMYDPSFVGPVMVRVNETVVRDLNNPSIIYWSVGNEDPLTDMHLKAVKCVKALDPTRPVCLPWNADETLPEEIDILAPHYWTAHEYDSIASRSKRPIITTEYVHAYGEMRFGGLEDCFRSLTRHPAGAGGAVWMWADQGLYTPVPKDTKRYKSIEKDSLYLRIDAAGWDGITDSYRHPTRDFWEVKSVYCPVYPVSARLSGDCSQMDLTMRNDYDFLTTEGLTIAYRVMVDGRQTASGVSEMDVQPHGEGVLHIAKTGLKSLKAGQTAYVIVTVKAADGHELGSKSMELVSVPLSVGKDVKLDLTDNADAITVTAGKCSFVFSRKTGMPDGMRPAFWHKLNDGDITGKTRIKGESFMTEVTQMTARQAADGVTVSVKADMIVNDSNRVAGDFTFRVTPQGDMVVAYSMTPQVTVKNLPLIGMALETLPRQWFGLGPEDAYPNKKAAPLMGLYDARKWSGTRAARWIDTDMGRVVLTPSVGDYAYIDRDAADSPVMRVVSHVQGRSEKGRLNDERYKIVSGETYSGTFRIVF